MALKAVHRKFWISLHKGFNLERAERAVRWTKEAGLRAKGLFMVGYPRGDGEDLKADPLFYPSPAPRRNEPSVLTPYPGTELYRQARGQMGLWKIGAG